MSFECIRTLFFGSLLLVISTISVSAEDKKCDPVARKKKIEKALRKKFGEDFVPNPPIVVDCKSYEMSKKVKNQELEAKNKVKSFKENLAPLTFKDLYGNRNCQGSIKFEHVKSLTSACLENDLRKILVDYSKTSKDFESTFTLFYKRLPISDKEPYSYKYLLDSMNNWQYPDSFTEVRDKMKISSVPTIVEVCATLLRWRKYDELDFVLKTVGNEKLIKIVDLMKMNHDLDKKKLYQKSKKIDQLFKTDSYYESLLNKENDFTELEKNILRSSAMRFSNYKFFSDKTINKMKFLIRNGIEPEFILRGIVAGYLNKKISDEKMVNILSYLADLKFDFNLKVRRNSGNLPELIYHSNPRLVDTFFKSIGEMKITGINMARKISFKYIEAKYKDRKKIDLYKKVLREERLSSTDGLELNAAGRIIKKGNIHELGNAKITYNSVISPDGTTALEYSWILENEKLVYKLLFDSKGNEVDKKMTILKRLQSRSVKSKKFHSKLIRKINWLAYQAREQKINDKILMLAEYQLREYRKNPNEDKLSEEEKRGFTFSLIETLLKVQKLPNLKDQKFHYQLLVGSKNYGYEICQSIQMNTPLTSKVLNDNSLNILNTGLKELGESCPLETGLCEYSILDLFFKEEYCSKSYIPEVSSLILEKVLEQFKMNKIQKEYLSGFISGNHKAEKFFSDKYYVPGFPMFRLSVYLGDFEFVKRNAQHESFPGNSPAFQIAILRLVLNPIRDLYDKTPEKFKSRFAFLSSEVFKKGMLDLRDLYGERYFDRFRNYGKEYYTEYSEEVYTHIFDLFIKWDVKLTSIKAFGNDPYNILYQLAKTKQTSKFELLVKKGHKVGFVIPISGISLKEVINDDLIRVLKKYKKWPIKYMESLEPYALFSHPEKHTDKYMLDIATAFTNKDSSYTLVFKDKDGAPRVFSSKNLEYTKPDFEIDMKKKNSFIPRLGYIDKWNGFLFDSPNGNNKKMVGDDWKAKGTPISILETKEIKGKIWVKIELRKDSCGDPTGVSGEGWVPLMIEGKLTLSFMGYC